MSATLKTLAKNAYCGFYKYAGLARAQQTVGFPYAAVLLFHRVSDEIPEDELTVSTARFESMCRRLQDRFRVVSLAEVFRIAQAGEVPPRGTVAITFDDGYRDNLFAARTLARLGLPACFFVTAAYMGTDRIYDWDWERPHLPNLDWDDVREMHGLGHEIGSHTLTHPDLAAISRDSMRYELGESKRRIEKELGRSVRWFAYPFGGREQFPLDGLSLVREAGYEGCLSGYGGFVHPGSGPFMLPREPVPCCSALQLEVLLSGGLRWLQALKRRQP
jgi:peptidoglycan/xylan/chitin deacetylase (PgdA/CDA1 family)